MKKHALCWFLFAVSAAFILALTTASCTPGERRAARSAFNFIELGCMLENSMLGDETVAKVCNIADDAIPDMKKFLAQQKAAANKYAASLSGCSKVDAGK